MKIRAQQMQNEEGFVLVTALLIMLVLTIIGIATTTNTNIELQIAGNDKVHKKTFYEAEAGAVLGTEVLEQSFNCPTGFKEDANGVADLKHNADPAFVRVYKHYESGGRTGNLLLQDNEEPADIGNIDTADVAYPIANITSGVEVGYLYYGGETQMLPGGALQMAAGYEGKGKSAAQGGVAKVVNIYSQFDGLVNSESIILFGWRHLVGTEGGCNY